MRFWMPGTCSSGISTPRSPRATIRASACSMIESSRSTACGFSILAITAARPRATFMTSARSSARLTKDRAIQSTPALSAASRSERSFSVIAPKSMVESGTLTPFRSERREPASTTVVALVGVASVTRSRTLPSSSRRRWPGSRASRTSGCGSSTRILSPGSRCESRMKTSPGAMSIAPLAKVPRRSFGPWRSARMPIGRSTSSSTSRIVATSARRRGWSVWLMLIRNMSAPASNRRLITDFSEEAGPSVARTLTFRVRLIGHRSRSRPARSAGQSSSAVRPCRLQRNRYDRSRGRRSLRYHEL